METPFFSIILPVRDAERTLPWLLDSVIKQWYADWELVAVDDRSTDSSKLILERHAGSDTRIRIFSTTQGGIVDALNTGISQARGAWTVRIDADDVCHPELLAELHQSVIRKPDIQVHAARVRYFPRLSLQDGLLVYEEWINGLTEHAEIARDMFIECPMPHPTLTCRRTDLQAIGGYMDMGWPEDYDLVFRLWLRGSKFSKIPRVLYYWRDREERLSRTHSRYALDRFMDAKVVFLLQSYLSEKREVVVAGAGPVGKDFTRKLQAQGVRVKAFLEVNPSKIGKSIHGITVFPVEAAARFKGTMILQAVGQKGTRRTARALYRELGLVETEDFLFVS